MNGILVLQGSEAVQALRDIAANLAPPPPDQFLSLKQAAEELQISVDTLARMAHAGEVPCKNLGTAEKANFRFSKNALSAWVADKLK